MITDTAAQPQETAAKPAEHTKPGAAVAPAPQNARMNIPFNLENWSRLNEPTKEALMWFHQHILDNGMSYNDVKDAIGYDTTVVFKILKGSYPIDKEGGYTNITKEILAYKKIAIERGRIQQNKFAENAITKMIFSGLSYCMANNSMTVIIGESRMGKSLAAAEWRDRNNHGRSVLVMAPAYGGTKVLLRDIAAAVGVNRDAPTSVMLDAITRAFNSNRILIIDEAHQLIPQNKRVNPVNLEIIRQIHDKTGCAVAFIATERFDVALRAGEYQFEQLLGRCGMPIRLPRKIRSEDIAPIVRQYIPKPSQKLMDAALQISNEMGRLGILVQTLKVASRFAAKEGGPLRDEHFFKSMALRKQMQGEGGPNYAAK